MQLFGFLAALVTASLVAALLEVEIEGGEGWAANLPTWRLENAWTRALLGNRAITGYHVYIHLFVLALLHLPFVLDIAPLTVRSELRILAFLVLFWIFEDFLWFMVNPAYGLRGFRKRNARWHARSWWWIMPREYWIFTPIGIALYVLSLA